MRSSRQALLQFRSQPAGACKQLASGALLHGSEVWGRRHAHVWFSSDGAAGSIGRVAHEFELVEEHPFKCTVANAHHT
jgi:hypothetical protein